jgi:uncharacterized protein YecE (DUF72 family)
MIKVGCCGFPVKRDIFSGPPVKRELLYVRLHGRTGYRYTYSGEDMLIVLKKVKPFPQAYLLFNNVSMYDDARRLKKLLEESKSQFSIYSY